MRFTLSVLSLLLFSLAEKGFAYDDIQTKKDDKRNRVAPYLTHLSPYEHINLAGANLSIIFGESKEVEGDNRAGFGLKSYSINEWLYQESSVSYLGSYQEVVSPVEPKHIYDDLIFSYQIGLNLNIADILIPYFSVGPGITLRKDTLVICRNQQYCFDKNGGYKTLETNYYLRPNIGASVGLKARIKGFEMDLSNYYLTIPDEVSSSIKFGLGFSL